MAPFRGPVFLFLLCLCCMAKTSLSMQCQAPEWDESLGPNPVAARRGKVVLVALLKGYCRYCGHQAARLHELKTELIADGFPDIDMVIINGGETMSRNLISNLVNASPIPVIQDTNDHRMYRQVFRGFKDDFLIYDRCGQASLYIPHPYSNLNYNITREVLKAIHLGRHSCYCALDYRARNENTDDVMVGDDPGASSEDESSTTTHVDEDIIQCDPDDSVCRRFLMVTSNRRSNNVEGRGWLNGGYGTQAGWGAGAGIGFRYDPSQPHPRRIGYMPGGGRWSRRRYLHAVGLGGIMAESGGRDNEHTSVRGHSSLGVPVAGIGDEHASARIDSDEDVPVVVAGDVLEEPGEHHRRRGGFYRVEVSGQVEEAGGSNRRRGGRGGSRGGSHRFMRHHQMSGGPHHQNNHRGHGHYHHHHHHRHQRLNGRRMPAASIQTTQ